MTGPVGGFDGPQSTGQAIALTGLLALGSVAWATSVRLPLVGLPAEDLGWLPAVFAAAIPASIAAAIVTPLGPSLPLMIYGAAVAFRIAQEESPLAWGPPERVRSALSDESSPQTRGASVRAVRAEAAPSYGGAA